jgi:aldehyde:ferredoxin oxidoreductase
MTAVCDSLIICRYTEGIYGFFLGEDHVRMANLTTGAGYSLEDLRKVGERVYTLERLFNVREGLTRKDDRLPERFLEEPIPGGPAAGRVVLRADLDQMLDEYYTARGWDPRTGAPTEEKLRELGL